MRRSRLETDGNFTQSNRGRAGRLSSASYPAGGTRFGSRAVGVVGPGGGGHLKPTLGQVTGVDGGSVDGEPSVLNAE